MADVFARYSEGPLFRRSAISKVYCADMCHSTKIRVMVKVRVSIKLGLGLGFGSALGLRLGLVGIVNFWNGGPSE